MIFSKVTIRQLTAEEVPAARALSIEIFGESAKDSKYSLEKWSEHLKENGLLLGAFDNEQLIGFKFGYQRTAGELHSWLGGVREPFRRHGIMTLLTEKQESWANTQGFQAVTVNTYQNKFPAMYQLLSKRGYQIIDEGESLDGKTHFRKILSKEPL